MISYRVPSQILVSANDRLGWREKAARTKQLRSAGFWTARAAKQPPMKRVDLLIIVHWPELARRRDRLNLAPTLKALVDGYVDAGVLPDDNDAWIRSERLITSLDHCEPGYAVALDFDFQSVGGDL